MANEFDPTTSNGAAEIDTATKTQPSTTDEQTQLLTPETPAKASVKRDTPVVPDFLLSRAAADARLSDEEQAVRSLDDTVMRDLPHHEAIWSEESRRPSESKQHFWQHIPMAALIGSVAVVSFVAGGVVARLSAQMPLLVPEQSEPIESTASYTPVAPVEQSEPEETEEEPSNPPSYDTGYDTTEEDEDKPTSNGDSSYQYYLDSEGNEVITYDEDTGLVTLDYDGYSLSVPVSDLIGSDDLDSYWSTPDSSETHSQNYGPHSYGTGTGYDTEEERDRYGWGGSSRTYSWNS